MEVCNSMKNNEPKVSLGRNCSAALVWGSEMLKFGRKKLDN